MYAELSPKQLVAGMVRVVWDHGPAHVELTAPGAPTVRLQLHHNPGLTKAEADRLTAELTAAGVPPNTELAVQFCPSSFESVRFTSSRVRSVPECGADHSQPR